MALTFNELIAAGSPLPRGAEAGDPTPTQLETTPTRPLFGSTPLARLQAPTLGERLGELITKTARAKYEERWASVEQELTIQYNTDQARLEAIAAEEEALLKHLQGMDKELQELAVARARGGVDDGPTASMMNAITARDKALDDSRQRRQDRQLRLDDDLKEKYSLSGEDLRTVDEVGTAVQAVFKSSKTFSESDQEKLLATYADTFAGLRSRGTEEQRMQAAATLFKMMPHQSPGDQIAVGDILGLRPEQVGELAVLRDREAKRVTATGGMRDRGTPDAENNARQLEKENKAAEVNTWAQSPEGRAVLAALGDDGQIDDREAAAIGKIRLDQNAEEASQIAGAMVREGAIDPVLQAEFDRLTATIPPAQIRREATETAGRYAVIASTPGIGELVSTDARRALDPRRLETLAALRALGEEEETVRSGMVAPTYRNIGSGVQAERLQAQAARQLSQGLRQDARQAGQAAAQTERERSIRQDGKPASPAQVAGARKQAKGGAQAALPGLDPNATPEMRRFAQAMAKSVAAGTWGDDQLPKQADDMFRLYQKGQLRDPGEAVRRAMELAPDDPDSVLVPYLQRVNKYRKDMDALPPGVDTSTYL